MTTARTLPKGYELVRLLGTGGFGEVLLARQTALDRLVAVKRLHGRLLADEEDLARFHREAQVLSRLHDPTIVRVIDFRRDSADAVLVMEYVEGRSLAEMLEEGALAPAGIVAVLADAARALSAATAAGVVHRDVKPDNVFVLTDGRAKLGDFGLARAVADPAVFQTTDGSLRCTPAYFAPELGQGAGEPDARSDAYAFAVMAYEALTGHLPYEDLDAVAMIVAHYQRTPPDPTTLVPGFPPAASAALLAGMAKDPAVRLLPAELVARLQQVDPRSWPRPVRTTTRAPATVRSTAPPPVVPALPRSRRRRAPLVAGAVAVVAVAGLAAVLLRGGGDPAVPLVVSAPEVTVATTGGCPSATYVFDGGLSANGTTGVVRVQWTRPDGVLTDPVSIPVAAGQRHVTTRLRFTVTGRRPLTARALLHVLTPQQLTATSAPIRYTC
jgi:serine/threonine-protein kinase